ncbi:amiloride-sensitive sodium channel subunit gamma-like [Ptychodera flava]|uniref:amiloride-sensitive sodium channel subunit gamma-like n=1 Tax=Ptychodera flava TaxID=63121 RepID=UPI003969C77E
MSDIMSLIPAEVRARVGHQNDGLIKECVFNGFNCTSKDFIPVMNPRYGNCYSFNTGANGTDIRRTSKPGPSTGLELTLFIEQTEYIPVITQNAGAVVLVHPPDNVPFPEEQGLELSPGFSTSLGVRLSTINRLGGKYSDCFMAGEVPLLYEGYNYSVEACVKTCHQFNLIAECQCYDSTLPHNNRTIPACVETDKGTPCMSGVGEKMKADVLDCRKNCHQPCSGKSYKETVSMSEWPSDTYGETLSDPLSEKSWKFGQQFSSIEEVRRNLIKLKVFFSDLNFESITENPTFDAVDLLSNLGGLMGLYIGASVISLFEFLEFVGKVCYLLPKLSRVSAEANTEM